jgi:hypothetical protein
MLAGGRRHTASPASIAMPVRGQGQADARVTSTFIDMTPANPNWSILHDPLCLPVDIQGRILQSPQSPPHPNAKAEPSILVWESWNRRITRNIIVNKLWPTTQNSPSREEESRGDSRSHHSHLHPVVSAPLIFGDTSKRFNLARKALYFRTNEANSNVRVPTLYPSPTPLVLHGKLHRWDRCS